MELVTKIKRGRNKMGNKIKHTVSMLIFIFTANAQANFEPFFDYTVDFTRYGHGGSFTGEIVFDSVYVVGRDSGEARALVKLDTSSSGRFRIEGTLGSFDGTNPSLTVLAGGETINVNSIGSFSWEGRTDKIYFYVDGSHYSLLAGIKHIPIPACHPDHMSPTNVVCLDWWNSSAYPERQRVPNCLGYAKNEAVYYADLGPNQKAINFDGVDTVKDGLEKIRRTMENVHGFKLESDNVKDIPSNSSKTIVALGVYYAHNLGWINDFHLIRKDKGNTYWTEKSGSQPVVKLQDDQEVKDKFDDGWKDKPANSPNGGNFFVGYFSR